MFKYEILHKIAYLTKISLLLYPRISVILNDKLKIRQDIDELAQDLSKERQDCKIGLEIEKLEQFSRKYILNC